jgi:hypothetical protein
MKAGSVSGAGPSKLETGWPDLQEDLPRRLPTESSTANPSSVTKNLPQAEPMAPPTPLTSPGESLPILEEELVADRLPPFPVPWRHPIRCGLWILRTLFGLASLTLLLAVAAAVPIVNFWVFGYLLDVTGRVARSGKLRASFPLLGLAPKFGSIVLGIWLCVLPLRLLAGAAADAELIAPGSAVAVRWQGALTFAKVAMVLHLGMALARGGSLTCFLRPIKNARWLLARWRDHDYWTRASTAIGQFLSGLNTRAYFSVGWRGFLGTAAWLFIPSALYASLHDPDKPVQILTTLIGGFGLWLTLMWAPLLQTRFAAENRILAFRELGIARELFRRAPIAWLFAIVLTYLLALPLYLFKAFSPPQDAMWFVTIVFVVSIFPTKVALGWAYGRSMRRTDRAWWVWRWVSKLLLAVLVAIFVFILFFTPAIGQHGRRVLFEHHALLLPVPF